MSIIEKANLPQGSVSAAVIGKCGKEFESFVSSFGVELLFSRENKKTDSAIKDHADVNVLYLGKGQAVLDTSQVDLAERLKQRGFDVRYASKEVSGAYPGDCRLNIALVGKRAFGRFDIADESVRELEGIRKINVRQGYAKCSVCVVNENAIITDDASICKAAESEGLRVLLVEKGSIALPGHGYGFIGGASALIGKNHLLFFGDITRHKSFEAIETFLKKEDCLFSYPDNYPLTDIGGMVAIEER